MNGRNHNNLGNLAKIIILIAIPSGIAILQFMLDIDWQDPKTLGVLIGLLLVWVAIISPIEQILRRVSRRIR